MIEEALIVRKITQPITLYFGLRFKEDIFGRMFLKICHHVSQFSLQTLFIKTIGRLARAFGHITDFIKTDFVTLVTGRYLCGNRQW
jgi:hypothetical protein